MSRLTDALTKALQGRNPVLYLHTAEEDRTVAALAQAAQAGGLGEGLYVWDCVQGYADLPGGQVSDPVQALQLVLACPQTGVFVLRDLAAFLDRPEVQRAVRNCYYGLLANPRKVVAIVSPELVLSTALEKEVALVTVLPPDEEEIVARLRAVLAEYPGLVLPPELLGEVTLALSGLTLNEVAHIAHRVGRHGITAKDAILEEIFAEKEAVVKKSGFLEFIPPRFRLEDIGGLKNLKDWLSKRAAVFNREAVAQGLPIPKGILLMGVSGCGKSLAAKTVSSLWGIPLYRLDMNLVFSGLYGSPEAAFHHALQTVEAVAPAVLWIDEIENALDITGNGQSNQAHIFSSFLTWMQEKPPLVFIAATANRIEALPAEVLRKGRFDQIFFVDLPTEEERRQILEIHLRRHGAESKDFDMPYLLVTMDEWNGAEIEQAIVAARVEAYRENRPFDSRDVSRAAATIVPLARTMREQIKFIRNWAFGRATPASEAGKRGPAR